MQPYMRCRRFNPKCTQVVAAGAERAQFVIFYVVHTCGVPEPTID